MSAPRIGPDAAPRSIGGPACRNVPAPGRAPRGRAGRRRAAAPAASIRPTAVALAAARRGSASTARGPRRVPAPAAAASPPRATVDGLRPSASAKTSTPAVDDAGAGRPSRSRLIGRPRGCAQQAEGGASGSGVGEEHRGARGAQRLGLASQALRVALGADQRDDDRRRPRAARAASSAGASSPPGPRRRRSPRTTSEQQHRRRAGPRPGA